MALKKLDIETSSRAFAFNSLGHQIMPCVTLLKKFDVTNLIKQAKKGHKINIIMNYVIGKAAQSIPEFFYRIDAHNKELYQGDAIYISTIVTTKLKSMAFCAYKYDDDFLTFEKNYLGAQKYCYENNENIITEDNAQIGTSTIIWENIDGVINGYGPNFTSPFIVITKFYKKWFRTYTNISFQFHHLQMDGEHALLYLKKLREEINNFKIKN